MKKLKLKNILLPIVGIAVFLFVIGCSKQNNGSMEKNNDIEKSYVVTPERIYINVATSANFKDDFNNSVKNGDLRFVGIMGYAMEVPEVPNYFEKYGESNGVKLVEGTSDSYDDSASIINQVLYEEYAKGYNTLLLNYMDSLDKNK